MADKKLRNQSDPHSRLRHRMGGLEAAALERNLRDKSLLRTERKADVPQHLILREQDKGLIRKIGEGNGRKIPARRLHGTGKIRRHGQQQTLLGQKDAGIKQRFIVGNVNQQIKIVLLRQKAGGLFD